MRSVEGRKGKERNDVYYVLLSQRKKKELGYSGIVSSKCWTLRYMSLSRRNTPSWAGDLVLRSVCPAGPWPGFHPQHSKRKALYFIPFPLFSFNLGSSFHTWLEKPQTDHTKQELVFGPRSSRSLMACQWSMGFQEPCWRRLCFFSYFLAFKDEPSQEET